MPKNIPIKGLKFQEYNPRDIDQGAIESLKLSIQEFGLRGLVTINQHPTRKGVIVGGNMTVIALQDLGEKDIPPKNVDFVNLPLEKEMALSLALNRIGQKRSWNDERLAEMMHKINKANLKLTTTGFDEVEISNLLDIQMLRNIKESEFNPDEEVEEMKKQKAKTKLGDIYQLGRHRLMCGNSTKIEDVEKLMGKEKADMVFTDPPYNVGYESTETSGKFHRKGKILGDFQEPEKFIEFIEKAFANLNYATKNGGAIYICSGYSSYPLFYYQMLNTGWQFSHCIIWLKQMTIVGWGDYKRRYEQLLKGKKRFRDAREFKKALGTKPKKRGTKAEGIVYGWKKGQAHSFYGGRNESDVWEMPRKAVTKMLHATEKPEWLIMKAVKLSSRVGQLVLDLFGGSGSTLAAAHKLERKAFLMELDPIYCDVILKRWELISGEKAKRLTK